MSPKQKKLAAKAPPPNKINEKDFAVLREEKAKGRGMGLQDEKVQPGKVMKANKGKSAMVPLKKGYSKTLGVFPTINKVKPSVGGSGMGKGTDKVSTKKAEDFMKRRKKLAGSKLPGKIGTVLGIGSMMVPAAYAAMKQYKDYKSAKNRDKAKVKKMGGGMMKKYSKGGGADSGRIGEMKSRLAVAQDKLAGGFRKARGKVSPRTFDKITERTKTYALAQSMKDKDRLTDRDIKKASSLVKGKMGGGMIGPSQRPGYSKGTMVKARGCKLGRTRPTKIT